jgi:hypothetical protein
MRNRRLFHLSLRGQYAHRIYTGVFIDFAVTGLAWFCRILLVLALARSVPGPSTPWLIRELAPAARADVVLNEFTRVRQLEIDAAVAVLLTLRRTLIFGVCLADLLLRCRFCQ